MDLNKGLDKYYSILNRQDLVTIICRQRSTPHHSEGIQKTFECYRVIQKCCILAQALPCDSAWRKTNIVLSTLANLQSLVGISTSNTASFKNVAQIFRAVILNQINGNFGHRNGPIKACLSALYEYLWRHGKIVCFFLLYGVITRPLEEIIILHNCWFYKGDYRLKRKLLLLRHQTSVVNMFFGPHNILYIFIND